MDTEAEQLEFCLESLLFLLGMQMVDSGLEAGPTRTGYLRTGAFPRRDEAVLVVPVAPVVPGFVVLYYPEDK